jgi:hypothetical protein
MHKKLSSKQGIEWNKVTWYSKLLSLIFLVGVVPMITFYIGMKYEEVKLISGTNFSLR